MSREWVRCTMNRFKVRVRGTVNRFKVRVRDRVRFRLG